MIHDIREAFNELLEENEWMDTETRHVAEDKANSMTERIGYPEYITNDTRLQEEYQNVCNGNNLSFTIVKSMFFGKRPRRASEAVEINYFEVVGEVCLQVRRLKMASFFDF